MSDEELDMLEIQFARRPPPPQRSIADVQEIIAAVDFTHRSACAGGDYYEIPVDLPRKGTKASEQQFAAPFAWRTAANAAFRYGDFDRTLEYIDEAMRSIPAHWLAFRGGITFSQSAYRAVLGDVKRSSALYSSGLALLARAAPPEELGARVRLESWSLESAAIDAYAQGRFREAELRLRDLRKKWAGGWIRSGDEIAQPMREKAITGDMFVRYLLVLSLANQNRLVEAEAEARLGMWAGKDVIDLVWMIDALSVVMLRQGRNHEVELISQRIADFFEETCAPPHYFIVMRSYLRLAQALSAQGKWKQALRYYERVYSDLSQDDSNPLERLLLNSPDVAISQILAGDSTGADKTLNRIDGWAKSQHGETSYQVREVVTLRALNRHMATPNRQTLLQLEEALTSLGETPITTFETGVDLDARARRMSLLVERYLSGMTASDLEKSAAPSFLIAQASSRNSVQTALVLSALRASVSDPELDALLRKFQDILNRREELDRLYAARATLGAYEGPGYFELDAEVQTLETAKATALTRLESDFPEFFGFLNNAPLSVQQATALLHPGEALVHVRTTPEHTYVWAVNHAGRLSVARRPLSSVKLRELVARLRYSVDPYNIDTVGDIPEFNILASFSLYEDILAPVRSVWSDAETLIVVTEGELQQIPFSLLVTREPVELQARSPRFSEYRDLEWLARSHGVVTLPSLPSLAAIRRSRHAPSKSYREFVGYGDPVFSAEQLAARNRHGEGAQIRLRALPKLRDFRSASLSDLPPLPDTREELLSIATSLGVDAESSVFLGLEASERHVLSADLSNVRTLSFATHGLVSGDLDGLNEPALAMSNPDILGDEEGDGLLGLSEIIGLRLNADLVILSACNSGSTDGEAAEALSGLGRAFFLAGTRSLLVSHWPVHTGATSLLMPSVFENMPMSTTRAEAVRRARVELIDHGTQRDGESIAFSYAHPIFWAPFSLVGEGVR